MALSNLNSEQLEAVTAPLGHNLIIASAGTGKTSTIVGRIANLLKNGLSPERILLLTFTNKASGEMVSRLKRYFPAETVDRIEAGTFHSVSYRWLKKIEPKATLKQPTELKTLFRSIYEKRDFNRLTLGIKPFEATYLYELFSLYQNSYLGEFDEWLLERYSDHEPLVDIYLDIVTEYEDLKREYGFLSFNDLLLRIREHLRDNRIEFDEVLVDEYQDTNTLQGALIDDLKPKSLFCVGDYDQSIYAFNGANIENISTFTQRYKSANLFNLSINYRSLEPILSLANRVIVKNPRIYPKKLKVGRKEMGSPPKLLIYEELFNQYQGVARLISNSSSSYEDIAVIFRNNASADGIEASLREFGIPCKRKGGTSFFETKEIKFLLDFISLLINPKDMMAFIHIFENARGIGTSTAKDIFLCLNHFGDGDLELGLLNPKISTLPKLNPNKNTQLGLFDDDLEIGAVSRFLSMDLSEEMKAHPLLKYPKLTKDGLSFFIEFHRLFKSLKRLKITPFKALQKISSSTLFENFAIALATSRAKLKNGEIDLDKRDLALERISRKVKLLSDLSKPYTQLPHFINAMILGSSEMKEGDGVNLLTVHASKGLEFREVYIIDLMDDRFPNRKLISKSGSLEEERRLFYVATTRAKDTLYLSFAKYDKIKKKEFEASIFLEEAGLVKPKKRRRDG